MNINTSNQHVSLRKGVEKRVTEKTEYFDFISRLKGTKKTPQL